MDRERIEANIAIARSRGSVHWYALARWFADDCEQLLAALAAAEAENVRIRGAIAAAATAYAAGAVSAAGVIAELEDVLASRPGEEAT